MVQRLARLNSQNSFFLFGARGTGKSTLIEKRYPSKAAQTLWIDLLLYEEEERFSRHPDELIFILNKTKATKVVIDEIQKTPKLLDIVQKIMRDKPNIQFIMSGSSARKLKRGAGNLLAGRAFQYQLFPFSVFEQVNEVNLSHFLEWGSLPEVFHKKSTEDKKEFLTSYVQTYLKEEIIAEQIVRGLNPFRNFLHIASQQSGQIVNYSNISTNIKADDKTVKNYFSILEDTLLGFFLPSFHKSVRKQYVKSPKFYLFDTGVKRALDKQLSAPLVESSYTYGNIFEHRLISECFYLNEYLRKGFSFYYLKTGEQNELDLIVERPSLPDLLVEIKSSPHVLEKHVGKLSGWGKSWPTGACKLQIWSRDKTPKIIGNVECLFWKEALKNLFF